jgi:propionyl-CoA carboxylase alpha chain
MGAQAVALAEAVDYRSAGTVEFIVDQNKNFYFLEMNTRIQVEHPVTEMVTGLDLVESMIRIAAGEPLGLNQDDVALTGWALEARVYAEDPLRGFMPSIGRLVRYREPQWEPQWEPGQGQRLRIDSGVVEGSEITMFYDPMIAKVVTHGETRDDAIHAMQDALDGFTIRGIRHNLNFLAAVIAKERFRDGLLTTGFIDEEFPDGYQEAAIPAAARAAMIAVAAVVQQRTAVRDRGGLGFATLDHWVVRIGGEAHEVALAPTDGGTRVTGTPVTGTPVTGAAETCVVESDWRPGMALFRGRIDGRPVTVQVDRRAPGFLLSHGGAEVAVQVLRPRVAELAARMPEKQAPDLSRYLLSPMPGLLVKLAVAAGQEVKAGDVLAVVEAMKMENVLRAERDGAIAKVHAEPGASLAVDQPILEFA